MRHFVREYVCLCLCYNPNLVSIFRRLGHLCKESNQIQSFFEIFVTNLFFYCGGSLAPRPTPNMEDHPLTFIRSYLFNIFVATVHSWRPFLHPQPEDVPCCGDGSAGGQWHQTSRRLHVFLWKGE
jgi:hypothetical protein